MVFDEKLDWHNQSNNIFKKLNQRLFSTRKLYSFNIQRTLLKLFYKSCSLAILNFCLIAWGGNGRVCDKTKINRALKCAGKMLSRTHHDTVDLVLSQLCDTKLCRILKDSTHPLNQSIQRSQRSGRILHIKTKTNRHLNSFLPLAIRNHTQWHVFYLLQSNNLWYFSSSYFYKPHCVMEIFLYVIKVKIS